MARNSLRRGMLQILIANVVNMFFSIGTNFLLPKYLSIESYSQIKTYQLYMLYIAIFHLGYNDGMYLKYGGKTIKEIDKYSIQQSLTTLRIFQTVVMFLCAVFSIAVRDMTLLVASLALLPTNMIAYFKNFYQAIGEFDRYSKIMNMTTGAVFLINIFLLAVVKTDLYYIYIIGYMVLNVIIWFVLEYDLHIFGEIHGFVSRFSFKELKENISSGILLMFGNMSSQFLTGMDRWFVKFFLNTVAFAQYAFAVSIENFLNIAVTPISITMYNYFCKRNKMEDISNIQEIIVVFSSIIPIAAFPVKFIIDGFLKNYRDATIVIFILFAAQIFYTIIKCIYVNLYKAQKNQKKYFSKLCFIIIIAFLFNIICYNIYHVKESFAVGTLLSAIIWFILCQMDFRQYKFPIRYYIYLAIEAISFLICGIFIDSVPGCLAYILVTIMMILLFMRNFIKLMFCSICKR